ncbi:hypothetical protein [Magnetospirillum sp. 15-1]|uniref:hypothetical protein n=1 Tax=Magnetospirillum sp. 15-1 TaxID=1979370 RepID=UPI000BBBEC1D|nr:hypothetical protein [Magnetospirillum sp. 15-1]
MVRRLLVISFVLSVAAHPALAWSTSSVPSGIPSGRELAEPDERVEAMTGRSEDGSPNRGRASDGRADHGGWSFSLTPGAGGSSFGDAPRVNGLSPDRPGRY